MGRFPLFAAALVLTQVARGQEAPTAILAGHVHPVSGPAIPDGVVLFRGGKIVAVGARDDVEIPADATVERLPDAHVYPGLVDALSTAFLGDGERGDTRTDAGSRIADGLDPFDERAGRLVRHGITTAFVAADAATTWRGLGAIVHLRDGGFELVEGDGATALGLRMTTGPGDTHPLARAAELAGIGRAFDGLDAYRKAFEDHEEKVKKYEEAFAKYLDHHRKKKASGDGEQTGNGERTRGEGQPTGGQDGDRGGRRRGGFGGRGGRGSGGPEGTRGGPPAEPAAEPAQGGGPQKRPADGDKPPERPKFPAPPRRDPAKDALLAAVDGELPVRIEARREGEVRAALALAREAGVPRVVIEHATGAAGLAADLAGAGIPVVVTDVEPAGESPYCDEFRGELAAELAGAGVPVAIASGDPQRARYLPLLAAIAVGCGLDREVALRAITLTPAEILGVQETVGSLEAGKRADLIVTDGPLLASGTRILRVVAGGNTEYEAQ